MNLSLSQQVQQIKTSSQLLKFLKTLNITKIECLNYDHLFWLFVGNDFLQISFDHLNKSNFEYTRRLIDSDDNCTIIGTASCLFNRQGEKQLLNFLYNEV